MGNLFLKMTKTNLSITKKGINVQNMILIFKSMLTLFQNKKAPMSFLPHCNDKNDGRLIDPSVHKLRVTKFGLLDSRPGNGM